ncbi:MAG: hypothetical protein IKP58_11000 [Victivallales bacterium]|nr:hypothetical protein [Victivallales bacterium]
MNKIYRIFIIFCFLSLLVYGQGETLAEGERSRLCQEAEQFFTEGLELSRTGKKSEAEEALDKAIARYERVAGDESFANGKLFYNLGNVYFLKNDLGRAILNYRRAEQYLPFDKKLQDNMAFARSRRVDVIEEHEQKRMLKTLFFLHYDLPLVWREGILLGCVFLFWAGLIALRWRKNGWLKWLTGLSFVLAVVLGISVWASYRAIQQQPAVIVEKEVDARKGGSTAYEKSFEKPLHAGTEVTLTDDNGSWVEIRLGNGETGWLPKDAVETVKR